MADSPTPSAEQVIGKAVHDYACGCDKPWPTNVNYEVLSDAVVRKLAEAGFSLVPEATDADLRERVASHIHWAIGGWIMGPWEQVTHEGQRSVVYRAADAAIAAGVKEREQLTAPYQCAECRCPPNCACCDAERGCTCKDEPVGGSPFGA